MTLFDPALHEPLAGAPWDEGVARAARDAIVADAEASAAPLWRQHPLERDDEPDPGSTLTSYYFGAAGTAWALRALGSASPGPAFAEGLVAAHRAAPDVGERKPGLLLGDLGVSFVAWLLGGGERHLDDAFRAADAAIPAPERELLWGAPGALLVARHVLDTTRDERWRDLLVRAAVHLLDTWEEVAPGVWLWTQDLYGDVVRYLGAAHGAMGNVGALLAAIPWLPAQAGAVAIERITSTFTRLARRDGDCINWTDLAGPGMRERWLVQWCHGAPGFVTALARAPAGTELDELMLGAGELTWAAGPLRKPFGLCHGTAGNAYAFLVLHARTGDERWLERARAFAMHAILQSEAARERFGARRFSFFTGDLGLAVFLDDVLRGEGAAFPGLDRF